MNSYEARQAARKARLEEAAAKRAQEGHARLQQADRMASVIPMGQPILVGHYSEGRDRNYRKRIAGHMDKGCEALKDAKELERRAAAVGTGGISSDDPDATLKLREQVVAMERMQELARAANRIYRSKDDDETKVDRLVVLGLSETIARRGLVPDFCGRIGFPDYDLKNRNANIRRVKERIAQLERERERQQTADPSGAPSMMYRSAHVAVQEDVIENRLVLRLTARGPKEVADLLKRSGWRWSPTRAAWVRMLNQASRNSFAMIRERLETLCEAGVAGSGSAD